MTSGNTLTETLWNVPTTRLPPSPAPQAGDLLLGLVELPEHGLGVVEQDLAGRCQLDRAGSAGAVEDGLADDALERGDLLADGGLGEAEAVGGAAEGPLGGHRLQRDEVLDLEVSLPHVHQPT